MSECSLCQICQQTIRKNGKKLICSVCNISSHLKCSGLSVSDHKYYNIENNSKWMWICQHFCQSIFSFHSPSKEDLLRLSYNSNTSCKCSKNIIKYSTLRDLLLFQTISNINNIPSLSNIDQI